MQSRGHIRPFIQRIREYTLTGRPGGTDDFVSKLEGHTERTLHKGKPRPKVG
jgi:hypothetical protein